MKWSAERRKRFEAKAALKNMNTVVAAKKGTVKQSSAPSLEDLFEKEKQLRGELNNCQIAIGEKLKSMGLQRYDERNPNE